MSQNIQKKICSEVRSLKQMFSNTPGSIEIYVNHELPYLEAPLKTGGHSAHPRVTAPVTRYLLVSLADIILHCSLDSSPSTI